jgi:hypothetical protein
MRIAAFGLAGAIALALSANAAPIAPVRAHENASNITKVASGCGRGFHLNGWGRCVPNRYVPAVESSLNMGLWRGEPAKPSATSRLGLLSFGQISGGTPAIRSLAPRRTAGLFFTGPLNAFDTDRRQWSPTPRGGLGAIACLREADRDRRSAGGFIREREQSADVRWLVAYLQIDSTESPAGDGRAFYECAAQRSWRGNVTERYSGPS